MKSRHRLNDAQQGVTLFELALVFVIVGLMMGATMGGMMLLETARIQSVMTEALKYQTAVSAFRTQYRYLPGDMTRASEYFDCGAGCNGNGDGRIDEGEEAYRAWYHLARAGLIEGNFSGTVEIPVADVAGVNLPGGPLNDGMFGMRFNTAAGEPQRHMVLYHRGSNAPAVTAEHAAVMDRKLDDGIASKGNVGGWDGAGVNACQNASGEYDLTSTGLQCVVQFYFE